MSDSQSQLPLFQVLLKHAGLDASSFHVPGHKNGMIFSDEGYDVFKSILPYDLTEITGLDDLHHPESAIKEAQELTAQLYDVESTFFLVGGTTAGNLAMILSVCGPEDCIIVQRNCHKSIMNAIELAGAKPVFISPVYEEQTGRYSRINVSTVQETLADYPYAKALVLTYPDYFGHTYNIQPMIEAAHQYQIPVLVDEAHGAHFILGNPFPLSSVSLGADIVVQSAHKMLPALTMSSYLHFQSSLVSKDKIRHYLQMVQSSSPSYPLMASLDLARHFLAHIDEGQIKQMVTHANQIRGILDQSTLWDVVPVYNQVDDPLKITLQIHPGVEAQRVLHTFEQRKVYPELATTSHLLLISGLGMNERDLQRISRVVNNFDHQLKTGKGHGKIEETAVYPVEISELPYSLNDLHKMDNIWATWEHAIGKLAGEMIIPYPPGVPLLIKGERIERWHRDVMLSCLKAGQHIQSESNDLYKGLRTFVE
ncbi:aminotransferase class V-fold PLP-dependent enzyme [Virgibacillus sp. MSP4-1]|uniref:aminotransferase class I/II-fold pyridoxal phosphate-dependent enzyme n=1 Tax=Virgibacillus sp. MSP4-1 TaxID=2700081 RepID=UPI0003A4DF75|nr:aminotransferase class V-fold PLP-dependent enzyme [Virgibacillus sp. MSP4-1]QHS23865.1 aminotransferase class V-fold PLP-dependent enzyme [Virgibacillus sp. MSP4-1]